MTAPKSATRARRSGIGPSNVPPTVAAWFGGQALPIPWAALLSPEADLVPAWWQQWAAAHPGAVPPADAPWIAWSAA